MRIARLRALTHFSRYLLVKKGAVEMSIARLRALTHSKNYYHLECPPYVEIGFARLRALTPQELLPAKSTDRVEIGFARLRALTPSSTNV